MLMLDGRAQRSLKTCKDLLTELLAKFEKISLESKPPSPDKESRIAFRLDIQAKATQLKNMGKQAKDVVKRMEKSPNKDSIQKALNDLTDFADGVQSIAALLGQLGSDSPDIEVVVKAFEESEDFCENCELFQPKKLGAAVKLSYLVAKASCCCLYSKYHDFWRHFTSSDGHLQSLMTLLSKEAFEAALLTEVENRLVMSLRAIQAQHVAGVGSLLPETGPVREAYSLCQAMLGVASEFPDAADFVPGLLKESVEVASHVLGQAETDITLLSPSVQKLQETLGILTENQQAAEVPAVLRFFAQHPVGQSLFEHAASRVESGKQEADMEKALRAFEAALEAMGSTHSSPQLLEEVFVPARNLWQECGKRLKALKAKKKFTKTAERTLPHMDKLEEVFFQKVKDLSQNELSSNLAAVLTLCLF